MKGGTYSEAVKAGFTQEQAAIFSRACIEIKNECWQHFEQQLEKKQTHKKDVFLDAVIRALPFAVMFSAGLIIGMVIQNT